MIYISKNFIAQDSLLRRQVLAYLRVELLWFIFLISAFLIFVLFVLFVTFGELGIIILPKKPKNDQSENKARCQTQNERSVIHWTSEQFSSFDSFVVCVSDHDRLEQEHDRTDNCRNEKSVHLILVAIKKALLRHVFVSKRCQNCLLLLSALLDLFHQDYVQPDEAVNDEEAIDAHESINHVPKHPNVLVLADDQDRNADCGKKYANQ